MKKMYLWGAACLMLLNNNSFSQSMNESFDSYTVGSYMGVNSSDWTTWSGSTGGAEDVQVTSANANSGSNSIYFSSTDPNGGPQDVVVPFGGQHNTGHFNWSSNLFVETGKGAYFNFQGETTIGNLWTFNCQMNQIGQMTLDDGVTVWEQTSYPTNTWFNLEVDVDLNTNTWEVFIDGNSVGVYQNANNQIASIDIFPVNSAGSGNDQSGFYMDDFVYMHTPFTLPTRNAAVSYIEWIPQVTGGTLRPEVTVRNLGTDAITSFDLTLDYNGNQITESITGVNINSMGEYKYDFTGAMSIVAGAMDITVTVSNVNGQGADDNAADDVKVMPVDPIVAADGRTVVGEEGTGTWCQWCPRGAVMMDRMERLYGDIWAGVAVHNGDPMVYDVYDQGIGGLIGGYPSGLVDREPEVDPSEFEAEFLQNIQQAPDVFVTTGATFTQNPGELKVSVTCDFQNTVSGQWKVALVLTEDSLWGTTSQWAQANAYAGGSNGPMGGYESLPSTVPASQMIYDHVGRLILPDFNGHESSFPSTNAGDVHTVNFTFWLDPSWDLDHIKLIGMVFDNTGDIDNADKVDLAEAGANGFVESTEEVTSVQVLANPDAEIQLYPNPAEDFAMMTLTNLDNQNVSLQVIDLNGRIVAERNYGELSGAMNLPINTANFEAGMYSLRLTIGEKVTVKKLVVK